jgi:endonuclease/exonuclease/phosphatase family metal-dependent hydrolase
VHSCRGADGRVDPARVTRVIAACGADIVALQELDVGRRRTGGIDQAQEIAAGLRHTLHFHPALHLEEEKYGDAILTALPSRLLKAGPLPSIGEPRGALMVAVEVDGAPPVIVVNTHFGLRRSERVRQAVEILGPDWLGGPECGSGHCVLIGDLNSVPRSPVYKALARRFRDAASVGHRRARPTFPARLPLLRLDHILLGEAIEPLDAHVVEKGLARQASDHLPLIADVAVA